MINKSISALGNCVAGLTDGSLHVPFRDSKLTRLLSGSLGSGSTLQTSAKLVLVASVGQNQLQHDETLSTLQFASRAKRVRNCVGANNHQQSFMEAKLWSAPSGSASAHRALIQEVSILREQNAQLL